MFFCYLSGAPADFHSIKNTASAKADAVFLMEMVRLEPALRAEQGKKIHSLLSSCV